MADREPLDLDVFVWLSALLDERDRLLTLVREREDESDAEREFCGENTRGWVDYFESAERERIALREHLTKVLEHQPLGRHSEGGVKKFDTGRMDICRICDSARAALTQEEN